MQGKSKLQDMKQALDSIRPGSEYYTTHVEPHQLRVGFFCTNIARYMKLPQEQIIKVEIEGNLHDTGKKPWGERMAYIRKEEMTSEERMMIKTHSLASAAMLETDLAQINGRFLPYVYEKGILIDIKYHHVDNNEEGYPALQPGEHLTLEAKILRVADSADAMLEGRAYSEKLTYEETVVELKYCSGKKLNPEEKKIRKDMVKRNPNRAKWSKQGLFDPEIVDAFLEIDRRIIEILYRIIKHPQ
jgi:response regulator RpfG family c-di-GMP phosphodiesterase